jgi:hypothetical protein
METIVSHIYHSPIGQISISADDGCISELIFIDPTTEISEYYPEEELPAVIHQCVDELMEYFHRTN